MAADRKTSSRAPFNRRRGFLLSLGAGGITAAAVALKPVSDATQAEAPAPAAPQTGAGYRETSHIRDYYRTTKL
jgi:hypothetical protein